MQFKDLKVKDRFKLSVHSKVFEKIPNKKRSSERPFLCNAKDTEHSNTTRQGYIPEDTIVYPVSNKGINIWVDSTLPAPDGWWDVSEYEEAENLLSKVCIDKISFSLSDFDTYGDYYSVKFVRNIVELLDIGELKYLSNMESLPEIQIHITADSRVSSTEDVLNQKIADKITEVRNRENSIYI